METYQKSFRESLLFRGQLDKRERNGEDCRRSARTSLLRGGWRGASNGRVIVNSPLRWKIRSKWFEFLSRKTNGRRDFGILMRHTEYRGASGLRGQGCFFIPALFLSKPPPIPTPRSDGVEKGEPRATPNNLCKKYRSSNSGRTWDRDLRT